MTQQRIAMGLSRSEMDRQRRDEAQELASA
jgi:hypothetical protein